MTVSSVCKHARTQIIAKDSDAEYIECLDCGAILETGELIAPAESKGKGAAAEQEGPPATIDESLSDA